MKIDMYELLFDLQQTGVVKVTGSFADGTNNAASDIDFKLTKDRPDSKKRNIDKVIAVFSKHHLNWDSCVSGHIATHNSNNPHLFIEIECSDIFIHRPNRLPTVTIEGVTFKTW